MFGLGKPWPLSVPGSLKELFKLLTNNLSKGRYNLDKYMHGRWYPVKAEFNINHPRPEGIEVSDSGPYVPYTVETEHSYVKIRIHIHMVTNTADKGFVFIRRMLEQKKNMVRILDEFDLRIHSEDGETNEREYIKLQCRAGEMGIRVGTVMEATGAMVVFRNLMFFGKMAQRKIPSTLEPERVIIDPSYEDDDCGDEAELMFKEARFNPSANFLPFVRVFSLPQRMYLYVDVRNIQKPEWRKESVNHLVMDDVKKEMIETVLSADVSKLPLDLIGGKHGGLVILATGPSGVGKTLTAEVFAEALEKPLYSVHASEIGGDCVTDIEENLYTIFGRAARWNALLLIDEADIFLQKRDNDLVRNAVTGVFLKTMDYFHGILFLTTNRCDCIDDAFASRITMCFRFHDLDRKDRERVWCMMMDKTGVKIEGEMGKLFDMPMNGREIRNAVRLMKVLSGDANVSSAKAEMICNSRVRKVTS